MARPWAVEGLRGRDRHACAGCAVVMTRLREARSYEDRARHPDNVTGLHDMRISVKRLRYAMELFVPCFGKRFRRCLKEIQGLQELLGSIHDIDVLITYLRGKLGVASTRQTPGVNGLLTRTRERRAAVHRQLCDELVRLDEAGLWASVPKAMRCALKDRPPSSQRRHCPPKA